MQDVVCNPYLSQLARFDSIGNRMSCRNVSASRQQNKLQTPGLFHLIVWNITLDVRDTIGRNGGPFNTNLNPNENIAPLCQYQGITVFDFRTSGCDLHATPRTKEVKKIGVKGSYVSIIEFYIDGQTSF
jgi:hypothetical protein